MVKILRQRLFVRLCDTYSVYLPAKCFIGPFSLFGCQGHRGVLSGAEAQSLIENRENSYTKVAEC